MSTRRGLTALVVTLLATHPGLAADRVYEARIPPSADPGGLRYGVTYRLWMPEGVAKVRGIVVHQHGCGSGACQGGRTAADDLHWQALARKWDFALLGPSYEQEDGQDCRLWCDPRNGSRAAFLTGLRALAVLTGHPEVERVPWCLWGHSGGGFWASLMQASDPERIVAIWLRSGTAFSTWERGEIPRPEVPEAAYGIPVMCNPGAKEKGDSRFNGAWTGAVAMFEAYRRKGAPIGLAPDPRTAHECGDSRYLAIPFFDACLAMRLPAEGAEDQTLKPVDVNSGWLAKPMGSEAKPFAEYDGPKGEAVWLPNERVAKAWAEYVTTGAVGDDTPPPAPNSVAARAIPPKAGETGRTVEITWEAVADFESGISGFVVERAGVEVARLPEKPSARFGRPLFQAMSYHDTPERPVPALRFVDATPPEGGASYRVIAINGVGLRSGPSESAEVRGR